MFLIIIYFLCFSLFPFLELVVMLPPIAGQNKVGGMWKRRHFKCMCLCTCADVCEQIIVTNVVALRLNSSLPGSDCVSISASRPSSRTRPSTTLGRCSPRLVPGWLQLELYQTPCRGVRPSTDLPTSWSCTVR